MWSVIKFKRDLKDNLHLVYPTVLACFVLLSANFELVDTYDTKEEADLTALILQD